MLPEVNVLFSVLPFVTIFVFLIDCDCFAFSDYFQSVCF